MAIRDLGYSLIKFPRGTNYSPLALAFTRVPDDVLRRAAEKFIPSENTVVSSIGIGQSSGPCQEELISGQHSLVEQYRYEIQGVLQITNCLGARTKETEDSEELLVLAGQVNLQHDIEGMRGKTSLPLAIMIGRKQTGETGLHCNCVSAEWFRNGGEMLVFDGNIRRNFALSIPDSPCRNILIGSLEEVAVSPDATLHVIASFGGENDSQNIRLNSLVSFQPGMILNFIRQYSMTNKLPRVTN